MKTILNLTCLFTLLIPFLNFAQVKYHINDHNLFTIKDTINNVVYSFDSGSEDSNLFDKGRIDYKVSGFTLIQNAYGKFRFIKKAKMTNKIEGLGTVKTKANILTNKEFSSNHCLDIDLLLGTKELKKHVLHFNNRDMILTNLTGLPANINDYIKFDMTTNIFGDSYYIPLTINGEEIKFLVDTGYSGYITTNRSKHLAAKEDEFGFYTLVAFEAAESLVTKYENNIVKYKDFPLENDEVYHDPQGPNIIGNAFFINFDEVILDFKNKNIYLLNEKSGSDPYPYDIIFSPTPEDKISIVYLKHSSSYYREGFRVGDDIILEDKGLEARLLSSPCETLAILKEWEQKSNGTFRFSKGNI